MQPTGGTVIATNAWRLNGSKKKHCVCRSSNTYQGCKEQPGSHMQIPAVTDLVDCFGAPVRDTG